MVELNWLLFCFLFLYLGQSAFNIWVDRINLIHAEKHANKAPAGFEGFIDESKLIAAGAYAQAKTRIGIFEQIVSDLTLLVIVLSGFLPLLVRWSDNLGLSLIAAGLLFFFVPEFIHFLVELPFGYYNTFVVEQKFGFNRSTLKLWIFDHVKAGLVSAVLFAADLFPPFALHRMVAPFLVVLGFCASLSRAVGDGDPLSRGPGAALQQV